jgi:hypothetical protein
MSANTLAAAKEALACAATALTRLFLFKVVTVSSFATVDLQLWAAFRGLCCSTPWIVGLPWNSFNAKIITGMWESNGRAVLRGNLQRVHLYPLLRVQGGSMKLVHAVEQIFVFRFGGQDLGRRCSCCVSSSHKTLNETPLMLLS